ncbi:hypothetical protein JCM14036_30740 [Desulfotomaculum defluvii]
MLMPQRVDKTDVERIVSELEGYENEIKQQFDICGMDYEKVFELTRANDGYVKESTVATVIPNDNFTGVERLYICSEIIADKVNSLFDRIYHEEAFLKIAEIYIKYTLVHELVHIKQIHDGRLTKEEKEQGEQIDYYDRWYEKEAIEIAKEIVEQEGNFERNVVQKINNVQGINNEDRQRLIEMFLDAEGKIT